MRLETYKVTSQARIGDRETNQTGTIAQNTACCYGSRSLGHIGLDEVKLVTNNTCKRDIEDDHYWERCKRKDV